MIRQGADLNRVNDYGCTALHYAVQSLDTFRFLMRYGADPRLTGKYGYTVLHSAAGRFLGFKECPAVIDCIVKELGISVDIADAKGNTPLFGAAENSNVGAIEKLLELGANINIQNKKKETALHYALKAPRRENPAFDLLLEKGADPRIKNTKGQTVLDLAREDLVNKKGFVPMIENAFAQWHGRPETPLFQPVPATINRFHLFLPSCAALSPPVCEVNRGGSAERRSVGSIKTPLKPIDLLAAKKNPTLPRIVNLNRKPDFSQNDKLDELHKLLGVVLPEYDEFITKYGEGAICHGQLNIFSPRLIVDCHKEHRRLWADCFCWEYENSELDEDDLTIAIILANTIDGDEFVWYPGNENDRTKKTGIYILPRNDISIRRLGMDLGDIFRYLPNLYDHAPNDVFWFSDILTTQHLFQADSPDARDRAIPALRHSGLFIHEAINDRHAEFLSSILGGSVFLDFEENMAVIHCDQEADTTTIEKILTACGYTGNG